MPSSSASINDLAVESLAQIFALLSPNERVRLERVCRKWRRVAMKYAWTEFRTMSVDGEELSQRSHNRLAILALIDRCGPHLRELSFSGPWEYMLEQWPKMRNLRHLRFDTSVGYHMLCALVDNLTRLRSIHFSNLDWNSVEVLHDLLRNNNASLQALRLPVDNALGDSLRLPALPTSLRSLHINARLQSIGSLNKKKSDYIDELLGVAASCCPQLAMLMLPKHIHVSNGSLAKLAGFAKLFYLRLLFDPSVGANLLVFDNTLAKIGAQMRALLLERADSRVLHLIANHCPFLEHCSFNLTYCYSDAAERLLPALQSLLQLAHLRSVSIRYDCNNLLGTQIVDALNGLIGKGKLEYLHLSPGLSLPAEFIENLLLLNPKLRTLTCTIRDNHTPIELDKLKTQLQNIEGPLELELFEQYPRELGLGKSSRIRVRRIRFQEDISQPMLREFWARTMDSVPDLGDLDD